MACRILDLGDILTLIEQAQEAFDEEEAMKVAEKLATEQFTLEDFLDADAAAARRRARSRRCSACCRAWADEAAARELRRARDRAHRGDHPVDDARPSARNPKLLNGSRRLRIATRLGHDGDRRQPARQALRAGREDDEDGRARRHAEDPGHGTDPRRRVRRGQAAAPRPRRRRARVRAIRPSARPRTRRSPRAWRRPVRAPLPPGRVSASAGRRRPAPSEEELAALQKLLGR